MVYCLNVSYTAWYHVTRKILLISAGLFETLIISELLKAFSHIEVTVVEPCESSMMSYKTLVTRTKEDLEGATFIWRQKTIQEFDKENTKTFHFVSLVHSMYFSPLPELEGHLQTVYEMVAEHGLIFSVHDTGKFNDDFRGRHM